MGSNWKIGISSVSLLLANTACSLNPFSGQVNVYMEVQDGGAQLGLVNGRSLAQAMAAPPGTTVDSFDCLMVNISGAGIPVQIPDFVTGEERIRAESGNGCMPSALSRMVDARSGGVIELSVPAGVQRKVRVIGIIANGGGSCPFVGQNYIDIVRSRMEPGQGGTGPVFVEAVLGEKVTDILTDSVIEVRNSFDPANLVEPFACNSGGPGMGMPVWKVATAKLAGTTCVTPGNGMVKCFGAGAYGQLGNGSISSSLPGAWVQLPGSMPLNGVRDIRAGDAHFCAVTHSNQLYCWGKNDQGQIGDGTITDRNLAYQVSLPGAVKHFDLGMAHTCASDFANNVYCWGDDMYGQLGNGGANTDSLIPVLAGAFAQVEQVALGSQTSCVIDAGLVKCWGSDSFGALGDGGSSVDLNSPPAIGITLPMAAKQITLAGFSGCATVISGAVHCWGQNTDYQLGDNSTTGRVAPYPSLIDGSAGHVATKTVLGLDFGCALLDSGQIKCWGRGTNGQLGNSASVDSGTPVLVSGGPVYTDLALGKSGVGSFACGVTGSWLACWGTGTDGQLGNQSAGGANIPTGVNLNLSPL